MRVLLAVNDTVALSPLILSNSMGAVQKVTHLASLGFRVMKRTRFSLVLLPYETQKAPKLQCENRRFPILVNIKPKPVVFLFQHGTLQSATGDTSATVDKEDWKGTVCVKFVQRAI